jgi:hypothetical protein
MATTSQPLRIDDNVYQAAKRAASTQDRTTAQQVTHWARLGCELEASRAIDPRTVDAVLRGEVHYDDVNPYEQAAVRAEWDELIDAATGALDLAAEFEAEGRSWVEADADGDVTEHNPAGPR